MFEIRAKPDVATLFHDEHKRPLVVTRNVGKGTVVVCTAESMIDKAAKTMLPAAKEALQRLHDECLPLAIEGDIEFVITRNETSWIVTLINNRGIRKVATGPTTIDHTKYSLVHIRPRVKIKSAKEWMAQEIAEVIKKRGVVEEVIISIPPGDVRVVELVVR